MPWSCLHGAAALCPPPGKPQPLLLIRPQRTEADFRAWGGAVFDALSESLSRQTREAKGTAGVQVEVREGLCQDALGRRQRVRQILTELGGGGAINKMSLFSVFSERGFKHICAWGSYNFP